MKDTVELIKDLKLDQYSLKNIISYLNLKSMVLYLDAFKSLKDAESIRDIVEASLILDASTKGGDE
jgi:hypothetical protein